MDRERLKAAVKEWQRLGFSQDALWSKRQLSEISGYVVLNPVEKSFLEASTRLHRRRKLIRVFLLLGLGLSVALVYGFIQIRATLLLSEQVDQKVAQAKRELANAAQLK